MTSRAADAVISKTEAGSVLSMLAVKALVKQGALKLVAFTELARYERQPFRPGQRDPYRAQVGTCND